MPKRKNTTAVLDDVVSYASRYGLAALGYALRDMIQNDEIHLTQENTVSLWEYGGNPGKL